MKITPDKIRVAVFDDNLFFLEAISDIVKGDEGLVLCGSFTGADNAIHDIKSSLPDVVMMDIDMPGTNGIDALRILRKHFPDLFVIML
ncbi:MAG TPA: response regulator, partial [Chitinophagaceae bacterium]|nr:response regulator [Chitinophagaceae bacterium]